MGKNAGWWCALAFILTLRLSATAQVNHFRQIDSLHLLWQQSRTDTARAGVWCTLAQYYFPINTDSGFAYAQKALQAAKKLNWKKGEVLALKAIGSNYWAKGDYLKCQDYFLQARDVALLLNDPAVLSIAYHALAISYLPLDNTAKAIEYLQKVLAIEKQRADPARLMAVYHNLADIYEAKGEFRQAFAYYEQSLPQAKAAKHGLGVAHTFMKLGTLSTALDDLPKGKGYLKESLAQARTIQEQPVVVQALMGLGEICKKQGRYNDALRYFDSALAVSATFNAALYIGRHGTNLLAMAYLYRDKAHAEKQNRQDQQALADLDEAIAYVKKALQVSGSVSDWVAQSEEALLLSDLYRERGKGFQALEAYKHYITYRDSVSNMEKEKQRIQHELKVAFRDSLQYLAKLQQNKLHMLAQQNKLDQYKANQLLLFAAIGLVVLALAGSLLLNRFRLQKIRLNAEWQKDKLQKQWREAELQRQLNDMTLSALHSQMNPHFIFNVLNTIQSFIYADNKRAAASCLSTFSELVRHTLDYSRRQSITLEEELEVVRLYTAMEKARFGEQLGVEITVDESLPLNDILLPPLFLQPYVENALKHGLLHRRGYKQLSITVRHNPRQQAVCICIDDNGIGRQKSAEINRRRIHHHSFANEANEKRAQLMKELWGQKITVTIEDKLTHDGLAEGTRVTVAVPFDKAFIPAPHTAHHEHL